MGFQNFKENVLANVKRPEDNRYLFLKKSLEEPPQDSWELPGGSIDEGETPLDAIQRELYEELNLRYGEESLEKYGEIINVNQLGSYKSHVYEVNWPEDREIELSDEHKDYEWCDEAEFLELVQEENVLDNVETILRQTGAF